MKKKLLFVIPTLRLGGAEKSLVTLLNKLDPNRLDITLFLFEEGGPLQKDIPNYVHILSADVVTRAMILEFRYYFKDLVKSFHWGAALSRLNMTLRAKYSKKKRFNWKYISRYIPNLDESFDVAVGYLEGMTDFYVIDKVNAKKKIGWIHIDLSKKELLPEEIDYYLRFDHLVTISDICKQVLNNIIPEKEVYVLENIVDKDEIINKSLEPVFWDNDKYHFVTVGRLEYQKGIDIALNAAKLLAENNLLFQWHVFGEGSLSTEIQNAIKEGNMDNIFILEGIRSNPYPFMRRADIIVQSSRWEGKSIVLDEAKLLGKAIIVTNYPSVTDQIENGKTGLIAKTDSASIAGRIMELIQNSELKQTLESNCEQEENNSIHTLNKLYELIDL